MIERTKTVTDTVAETYVVTQETVRLALYREGGAGRDEDVLQRDLAPGEARQLARELDAAADEAEAMGTPWDGSDHDLLVVLSPPELNPRVVAKLAAEHLGGQMRQAY